MEALPYRIIFEQLHNGHPWNALENDEFLMKLRAVAKNKKGSLYPTTAGLLFFGEAYHITDVFPNNFLDYREEKVMKASQRKKQWNCVNIKHEQAHVGYRIQLKDYRILTGYW